MEAVLRRAQGVCESCGEDAPFTKNSDGAPYLEVHHKLPLAEKCPDSVNNAIALCPNCHRKAHYGTSA
ncbi:HNH endonuclease [Thioalkalivibrio sp. ALMg9]|uniref:HNH endonuclease n=1 Tax=Thioalkalivibrio sp. ALMg9 TaxID=1266912 RepID=UPI0018C8FC2A